MPENPIISVGAVVSQLEMTHEEYRNLLNRRTGEFVMLPVKALSAAEDGEDLDELDLMDWEREDYVKAQEVAASADYVPLPDRYDIHEYSIMEGFCCSIEDDGLRNSLLHAIRGSGAFRRFKDAIHRFNIADDWYDFYDAALERIAIDWLETHNIPYTRRES